MQQRLAAWHCCLGLLRRWQRFEPPQMARQAIPEVRSVWCAPLLKATPRPCGLLQAGHDLRSSARHQQLCQHRSVQYIRHARLHSTATRVVGCRTLSAALHRISDAGSVAGRALIQHDSITKDPPALRELRECQIDGSRRNDCVAANTRQKVDRLQAQQTDCGLGFAALHSGDDHSAAPASSRRSRIEAATKEGRCGEGAGLPPRLMLPQQQRCMLRQRPPATPPRPQPRSNTAEPPRRAAACSRAA